MLVQAASKLARLLVPSYLKAILWLRIFEEHTTGLYSIANHNLKM